MADSERPAYRLKQEVLVRAFGRWRPGVVTKIGRTRVTVDYQSNQHGGRRLKAFYAVLIVPADPRCSVCGALCHWSDDAWVCTDDECGSEWDPDHGPEYVSPGGE